MMDRVFSRALFLAGEVDDREKELLRVLCGAGIRSLEGRLKPEVSAEDCGEDFVIAASLYALDLMARAGTGVREFRAGDLTVKTGAAGNGGLAEQAERILRPYLADGFRFVGV